MTRLTWTFAILLLAACEDSPMLPDASAPIDAGTDAGVEPFDGGGADAHVPDAGAPGSPDAGPSDAAGPDAAPDAGCVAARFVGLAPNDEDGTSHGIPWQFGGMIGAPAGELACTDLGADHVCTHAELQEAERCGELSVLPEGTTLWVHRLEAVEVDGATLEPGVGARCNDWSTPRNDIADGEYATITADGVDYVYDADGCYGEGCGDVTDTSTCFMTERAIPCCAP